MPAINSRFTARPMAVSHALGLGALLSLAACGGGGSDGTGASAAALGTATVSIAAAPSPAEAASGVVLPAFHVAPVILPEPDDADGVDNAASARSAPRQVAIDSSLSTLSTQRLTVQALQAGMRARALSGSQALADASAAAKPLVATTYTPAQIRAAYALPALPAIGASATALQAAQQGAGQTVYIIDAMHDPNAAVELAAFNAKFGLPTCTSTSIAVGAALPLPAASATAGCSFSVVYSTQAGTMTATAPAYDANWATEIALDVQWVHATAPRARIVLIEAADSSFNGLTGAIKLANAMGAGVVSMSFGGPEGNWTAQSDPGFSAPGMSYLAATGDNGSGVSWPAVSPKVLAVGGTTLAYAGGASRSESAWSGSGGGISAYTPTPAYQSNTVPGLGLLGHRAVADVSFNADPYSGQYVAVQTPGNPAPNWLSVGGTSLATPQWAGVIAIANALRAASAKTMIGAPHAALYGQIASVPGTYAAAFDDIVSGADGSCGTCSAKSGYDIPTGLGTPNVSALLTALGASTVVLPTPAPTAPTLSAATVNGKVGTPLAYTIAVGGGSATSFALSGAPSGMSVSAAGVLSWPAPVAGNYAVTVTAANAGTGLSGKAVLTVVIAPAAPPVITAPALTGVAGKPLSGAITVSSPSGSPMTVQIGGVPAGIQFTPNGASLALYWPSPIAGKYQLSISARDATGLASTATLSITVNAK